MVSVLLFLLLIIVGGEIGVVADPVEATCMSIPQPQRLTPQIIYPQMGGMKGVVSLLMIHSIHLTK